MHAACGAHVVLCALLAAACSSERTPPPAPTTGAAPDRGTRVGSAAVTFIQTDRVIDLDAWRAGCDGGDIAQCELLANQYAISPEPARVAESVAIFEKACASRSLLGCYAAGKAYLDGKGVAADRARGLALLQQGCDLGHHWACERLKP